MHMNQGKQATVRGMVSRGVYRTVNSGLALAETSLFCPLGSRASPDQGRAEQHLGLCGFRVSSRFPSTHFFSLSSDVAALEGHLE